MAKVLHGPKGILNSNDIENDLDNLTISNLMEWCNFCCRKFNILFNNESLHYQYIFGDCDIDLCILDRR